MLLISDGFGYSDWFVAFLPYWPPGEPVGADRERTEWIIRTLEDIPADRVHLATGSGLDRGSPELVVESWVAGTREIVMTCTTPAQLEGPYRLGAAQPVWRFVDEQVARIWTIGAYPRLCFSTFKRQREELLQRLPEPLRTSWLGLVLLRSEPLLRRTARERLGDESFPLLVDPVAVAERFAGWSVSDRDGLGIGDLARLLPSAVKAAVAGTREGSVPLIAYASERLLEALIQVDETLFAADDVTSLAQREDRLWFDDALRLADSHEVTPDLIERSQAFASDLAAAL